MEIENTSDWRPLEHSFFTAEESIRTENFQNMVVVGFGKFPRVLAVCESEAKAATCFAPFRACNSFVVDMAASPLT
jgi:hypothetical protein